MAQVRGQNARKATVEAAAVQRLQRWWRLQRWGRLVFDVNVAMTGVVPAMHVEAATPPPSPPPGASQSSRKVIPAFCGIYARRASRRSGLKAQRVSAAVVSIGQLTSRQMRRLYTQVAAHATRRPAFRSLPEFLFWPNLEVMPIPRCAAYQQPSSPSPSSTSHLLPHCILMPSSRLLSLPPL